MALYPDELKAIDTCLTFLTLAVTTPSSAKSSTLSNSCMEAIVRVLERWPSSSRFPSEAHYALVLVVALIYISPATRKVIDLGRLLSSYCPRVYADPAHALNFFHALLDGAEWGVPWETPLPKHRDTNVLLALRALANGFQDSINPQDTNWVQEASVIRFSAHELV